MDLHNNIGLSGIPACESVRIRRLGRLLRYLEIPVIIWLALQWHWELFKLMTPLQSYIADWCVWLYFLIKLLFMVNVVERKLLFIRRNWGYFSIIIAGCIFLIPYPPIAHFFQFARLLLMFVLLIPWIDACRVSLSDNRLGTTILTAAIIIVLAGILISGLDDNIRHWYDGIWWAWVTVSTVGYGDVVPSGLVGRLFASFLIFLGLGLFSVFTANFSALFIQRSRRKRNEQQKQMLVLLEELRQLHQEENKIESSILELRRKLDKIESLLEKKGVSKDST